MTDYTKTLWGAMRPLDVLGSRRGWLQFKAQLAEKLDQLTELYFLPD